MKASRKNVEVNYKNGAVSDIIGHDYTSKTTTVIKLDEFCKVVAIKLIYTYDEYEEDIPTTEHWGQDWKAVDLYVPMYMRPILNFITNGRYE